MRSWGRRMIIGVGGGRRIEVWFVGGRVVGSLSWRKWADFTDREVGEGLGSRIMFIIMASL